MQIEERLSILGHELRTPLTTITGFAELLHLDLADRPDLREMVEIITDAAQHMSHVADGMLTTAADPLGRRAGATCDPWSTVCWAARGMEVVAKRKNLAVRVVAKTPVPRSIPVDGTQLRQIITNLVANAVRHTSQGGIRIEILVSERPSIAISVCDTGSGIAAEHLPGIFTAGMQVDPMAEGGGRGLGLWICRQLAEQMGGSITAQSQPGKGSVFRLEIPLEEPSIRDLAIPSPLEPDATPLRLQAIKTSSHPLAGYAILVVDDFPANRLLISSLLKRHGAGVTLACNGGEACDRVAESMASGKPYDLVVMDVNMPVLNGVEAVRRIRSGGSSIPILGCTADLDAELVVRHRAMGFTAVMRKPFHFQRFIDLVAEMAQGGHGRDYVGDEEV